MAKKINYFLAIDYQVYVKFIAQYSSSLKKKSSLEG